MATFMRLTEIGKRGALLFILPTPIVGALAAFPSILAPEKPYSTSYATIEREATIWRNLTLIATAGTTLTLIGAVMVLVGREQYSATAEWETVGKPPPPGSWNEKGQP